MNIIISIKEIVSGIKIFPQRKLQAQLISLMNSI
jgi:hypothetical protein